MRKLTAVFCLVTGALWAVSAAPLEVNGKFRVLKAGRLYDGDEPVFHKCAPEGWEVLPERSGRFVTVQSEKDFRVRIISTTSNTFGFYYRKKFLVRPGEKYRLSVDANGKNTVANVGALFFSNEADPMKSSRVTVEVDIGDGNISRSAFDITAKKYIGDDCSFPTKLNGKETICRTISIPSKIKGATPCTMQVYFYVKFPAGITDFSNFRLEKVSGSVAETNYDSYRKLWSSERGKKK